MGKHTSVHMYMNVVCVFRVWMCIFVHRCVCVSVRVREEVCMCVMVHTVVCDSVGAKLRLLFYCAHVCVCVFVWVCLFSVSVCVCMFVLCVCFLLFSLYVGLTCVCVVCACFVDACVCVWSMCVRVFENARRVCTHVFYCGCFSVCVCALVCAYFFEF